MNLPQGWQLNETISGWILIKPDGTRSTRLANRWLAIQIYLGRMPFNVDDTPTRL